MYVIKDPDWYLKNQSTFDKIYSNLIFLFISYYIYKNYNDTTLSILFLFLFIGSTLFHVKTNKNTLLLDRLSMVLVFSYFFYLFYPKISFEIYSILGILTVFIWFLTENLLFYFLFQFLGLLLFLFFAPLNTSLLAKKSYMNVFIKKIIFILVYVFITYSQLYKQGKFHSLKHLLLGLLSLYLLKLIYNK